MSTFDSFINSSDPATKGKQFELFVKWFLQHDPEWSTQVKLIWDDVDFKDRIIRISAARMKMSRDHLVPMSNQVIDKLIEIKGIKLSDEHVFPSPTKGNSHISPESLRAAINRLGVSRKEFTTHGFRSMASTRLNEMGFNSDWIEVQLSHKESNSVRGAYNNAEYIDQRRDMMQQWADYLDVLKEN